MSPNSGRSSQLFCITTEEKRNKYDRAVHRRRVGALQFHSSPHPSKGNSKRLPLTVLVTVMSLRGEQSGTVTLTLESKGKQSNHKNLCRKPPSLSLPNESTISRTPIGTRTGKDSSDIELGRLPVCSPCRLNSLESVTTASTTSAVSSVPAGGTSPLHFRSILPADRERIQDLHEEWFPVSYHSDFFDDLVLGKMCHTGDPLYTNLVVTDSGDGDPSKDDIVACIVAAMMPTNKLNFNSRQLLISDPSRHTQLCYIMTLGTLHPYRKGGLATQLVEQCIADLVQSNPSCGTLYLHVITTNMSAIRFYERLGFWRVREIPDYYTIEGETHNCYLYAKYFHGNNGHIDWVRVVVVYLYKLWQTLRHSIVYLVAFTSRQAMYYRRSFPSRSGSDPHNQNTHHKY